MRIITVIICFFLFYSNMNAQLALAVAKNDNGSSIKYSLKLGKSIEDAAAQAQKELEDLEFKNINILKSTENTGHGLTKGFYVLLISSRKDYAGKLFVSYGLGASEKSRQEAIDRAILHMTEFDWGYDKKYGFAVEKEGLIESFYPKEEK
jgi:hypothetical protein